MSAESLKFQFEASGNLIDYVNQSRAAVNNLDNQINRSSRMVKAYGAEHSRLSNIFKFAKGAAQQAGYQIGDYAVQVANGTSKMQAFGQQGAQLAGIFGPVGAVIGAGIALYSAWAVAQERATKSMKDTRTAVERLSDAFSTLEGVDFSTAMSKAARSVDPVISKYTGLLQLIQRVGEEQRASALTDIVRQFSPVERADEYRAKLTEIGRLINDAVGRGLKSNDEGLRRLLASQTEYEQKLNAEILLRNIIAGIQGKTREEVAENLAGAVSVLETLGRMTPELRLQLKIFADQAGLTGSIKNEVDGAADNAEDLAKAAASAREEFEKAAAAVMNINANAAGALAGMNAQLRSFQRGLSKDQVRVMEASRKAEIAAREAGVDSAAELAAIAGEAAAIERQTIAAENSLKSFTTTASGSAKTVKQATKDTFDMFADLDAQINSVTNIMQTGFQNAFMSVFDNTKTAKEKFKDMARYMIQELYKVLVVQQMVGSFTPGKGGTGLIGGIASLLGFKALGGPITAGKPYMVGERGPELVVPSRNASVIPNNRLGGGGVTVNQNITFGSGVSRAEIQQMLPKIVETTKAAVFDAQRRSVSGMGY